MGLVLGIVVWPIILCVLVIAVGIGVVRAATAGVRNSEAKDLLRGVLIAVIIAFCVYLLSIGVFSPRLPAWH